MKIVILYSGGADSFILEKFAKYKYPDAAVHCIYYDYHNPTTEIESEQIPEWVSKRNVDWYNLIGQEMLEKKSDPGQKIYIPGRNLVFAILAACQEMPDEIWMGTVAEEDHPDATDKNETFVHMTETVMNYVLGPFLEDRKIKIRFPFVECGMTKLETLHWALNNGVTGEEIRKTISCYYPIKHEPHYLDRAEGDKDWIQACGTCKQCTRRALMHKLLEIYDENDYDLDPFNNAAVQSWMTRLRDLHDKHCDESILNEFPPYFVAWYDVSNHWIHEYQRIIRVELIPKLKKQSLYNREFDIIEELKYGKHIDQERNPLIRSQLMEMREEASQGERITDTTPESLKTLFRDGYVFFGSLLDKSKRIVDVCCGDGRYSKLVGADLGLDIVPNSNIKYILQDVKCPLDPDFTDTVHAYTWLQAIEHFTAEDQHKIIINLLDTKPKFIAISTINKNCYPFIDGAFVLTGKYNPHHLHELDIIDFEDLSQYFERCKFWTQFFWNGESHFINGLHEYGTNFYMIGETS